MHAVNGYRPSFRLAARREGRLLLFEAFDNPRARTWGDLLDLDGKVARITIGTANACHLADRTATSLGYNLPTRRVDWRNPLPRSFGAAATTALR